MITIKKYAALRGKNYETARKMAYRGGFKTAQKIGRDWLIDEDEPWPDRRVKSGRYIDWRKQKE